MAVLPHPAKENTWVINYVTVEGGSRVFHKLEFTGSLKDALLRERELLKPVRG